jgi:hypothetical protein
MEDHKVKRRRVDIDEDDDITFVRETKRRREDGA